jgi:hypothetical protein
MDDETTVSVDVDVVATAEPPMPAAVTALPTTAIDSVVSKLIEQQRPPSATSSSLSSIDTVDVSGKRPATDGAPTPPTLNAKRRRKPEGTVCIQ